MISPLYLSLLLLAAMYFIVNLMVLGTLLAIRLALTTIQVASELKEQREQRYERDVLVSRFQVGRYDRTWRQGQRRNLLDTKSAERRRKGSKSWV